MKRIFLILITILLLSCATIKPAMEDGQNIKIWQIDSYIKNNKELVGNSVKDLYFTYNPANEKFFIRYLITGKESYNLEQLWKKYNKDLRVDRVNVVQELKFKREKNRIIFTEILEDVVIEGNKTEIISNKINKIIYSEREGESTGLITLLVSISNPTVLENIPYPRIGVRDEFYIRIAGGSMELYNIDTKIKLSFIGEQQWIEN